MSAGARFRAALEKETPLQVVGTINAYSALLAEQAGFRAIYLSGAGVANASFGLPDLAMTTLGDVCEDIRRISYATELPLLRRQKPWLVGSLRLVLVAIPLVLVLAVAKRDFDRDMAPLLGNVQAAVFASASSSCVWWHGKPSQRSIRGLPSHGSFLF